MPDSRSFDTSHCTSNNLVHCASEIIVHDSYVVAVTKTRDCVFQFADFEKVIHIPACFSCGYSYIIFVDGTNAGNPNHKDNYFDFNSLDFGHKIWLCAGVFSYKKTAATSQEVYDEIVKRFDAYKSHEIEALFMNKPQNSAPNPMHSNSMSAQSSNADEIRKYKQLLDDGIISQEEFEAKKKQLLGL